MESTAVSIGKSALKGALGCAKSGIMEEVAMELGVQHDKAFITDELEMMQSFLMEAHDDERDKLSKVVTTWVNQVRDVAYDVEDGLQDVVLHVHGQSWWGIPRTLLDRRHVAEQMKELRATVEDVSQRNVRYRLIYGASKAQDLTINTGPATDQTIFAFHQQSIQDTTYSSKISSNLVLPHTVENEIQDGQSYSEDDEMTMIQESLTHTSNVQGPLEEFQLIGREKEKSDIIEQILEHSSTQQIQVIAVWGKGSVGKSTVIRDVYESQEVNQMFEEHAYVTVLQPFKLEQILSSLAFQLDGRNVASTGVIDFDGVLDWCLQEKSCLIILDDLSSTTEWDIILPSLLAMNRRRLVLLIITRQEDIAKHCCQKTKCIHLLNGLEEKDACDLFTEKVFKSETTDLTKHYPELVEPANLILKRCNGIPLAIVTIGGFLAEQPTKTVGEWRKLDRCISVEMGMNPKIEAVKAVLMKSYDGLPYYLKSSILYLSIFLEDRTVSRRRLVCRWVAEGYAEDTSIAERYFMELLERSMILPTQISLCSMQGTDSCQVHDLIRDIIIEKSMEENLIFRLEEGRDLNNQGAVRHLVISSDWDGDESRLGDIKKLSRIRSLTVFGKWRPFYISDKMRFLRVLDLEGTKDLADHHLEHIGKHLHLRYLSLRGCEGIYYLPDSVGNLRQLETLDIKYTRILRLPKTITKLSKLCQLKAGNEFYVGEERSSLACCVPFACCCAMVIRAYAVKVPIGIGELKFLNMLRCVHLEWENAIIQEIEGLTNLRKLGVYGIDRGNGPEFCSAISGLRRLESLSVQSSERDLCDILHGMSSPPENLRSLKLHGWMDELPQWIKVLQNLVKIKLELTEVSINDEDMRILGNLPNLSIMSIKERSFQSALPITFHSGLFRSLVVLELVYMEVEVGSLEFEATSMPKLEVLNLRLIDCKIDISGQELLPSIKEVRLLVFASPTFIALKENMTEEAAEEEARHREDKVKADMRKQLANNKNRPILKVQ